MKWGLRLFGVGAGAFSCAQQNVADTSATNANSAQSFTRQDSPNTPPAVASALEAVVIVAHEDFKNWGAGFVIEANSEKKRSVIATGAHLTSSPT